MTRSRSFCLLLAVSLWAASAGRGAADVKPLPANVGVDEKIRAELPRELPLTDERGRTRTLADWLRPGKPLLLSLAYDHCPACATSRCASSRAACAI